VRHADGRPLPTPRGGVERGEGFEQKNNHSIVTRVDFGMSSILFTGDLEEPAIDRLVARHQTSSLLDVVVYEVGHHGSHNGTTPELLAKDWRRTVGMFSGNELMKEVDAAGAKLRAQDRQRARRRGTKRRRTGK